MDDTPKDFLEEVRTSILRKRVGQIALAVVLAQGSLAPDQRADMVPSDASHRKVFQWQDRVCSLEKLPGQPDTMRENVAGSIVEFAFTVIAVFYLNRWIHQKRRPAVDSEFSLLGEPAAPHPEASVVHDPSQS